MWKFLAFFQLAAIALAQERPNQLPKTDDSRKGPAELRTAIFKKYDSTSFPVKTPSKKLSISVNLVPVFIEEVDEKKQMLTLDAYLHMRWKDDYLRWNSESHQGVEKLVTPSHDIWTPDIITKTRSSNGHLTDNTDSNAIIYSSGEIAWTRLVTINSFCPMNFSKYPDDIQTCPILLHSQSYDSSFVTLTIQSDGENLEQFDNSDGNWLVETFTNQMETVNLSCCSQDLFSGIKYDIVLKRRQPTALDLVHRMSYYAVFLALLMFWLPPDSLHKVLLGALSQILLWIGLFHLSTTLPSGEAVNAAAHRLTPTMCLVGGALFAEVLIISIARMLVNCRPSRCLLGIARCCCQPFCICASRAYGSHESRASTYGDKGKKHPAMPQDEWNVIAAACDRLLFLVCLLGAVYLYKFHPINVIIN